MREYIQMFTSFVLLSFVSCDSSLFFASSRHSENMADCFCWNIMIRSKMARSRVKMGCECAYAITSMILCAGMHDIAHVQSVYTI